MIQGFGVRGSQERSMCSLSLLVFCGFFFFVAYIEEFGHSFLAYGGKTLGNTHTTILQGRCKTF